MKRGPLFRKVCVDISQAVWITRFESVSKSHDTMPPSYRRIVVLRSQKEGFWRRKLPGEGWVLSFLSLFSFVKRNENPRTKNKKKKLDFSAPGKWGRTQTGSEI